MREFKLFKIIHALFWDTVSSGVLEIGSPTRRGWVNGDRSGV